MYHIAVEAELPGGHVDSVSDDEKVVPESCKDTGKSLTLDLLLNWETHVLCVIVELFQTFNHL